MHRRAPAAPYIDDDKEEQPDNVHKVPIPGCCFEAKVLAIGEVPLIRAHQTDDQEDRANEHVEAVKARRHIEGGAVVQALKGEGCVNIFIDLNRAEEQAKCDGQPQPFFDIVIFIKVYFDNNSPSS